MIRGLAVGVSMRQIFRRELATGLITGGLIGVAFYVFARAPLATVIQDLLSTTVYFLIADALV